jgi:pimeloyl-ACP methyl ester carboxylesterase
MVRSIQRIWWKRALRLTGIAYLLIIALGFVLDHFYQFRQSDEATTAFFNNKKQSIHISYYQTHGREMRYLYTDNNAARPTILFIHGAPSSSSYFRDYLSDTLLRRQANLYAVDRPGYGYSGFGEPVADIQQQAAMIKPLLDSLHQVQRPVILVAASYGTSVASRIAMDYPQLIDGLVLLAPSLAPGEEKTYSISYVLETPLLSWVQPRMIHSANVEKLSHEQQLRNMLPYWKNITTPVIYFQGEKDELIYTSNAAFAKAHLINSQCLTVQMLPDMGHLIAFKARKEITEAICEMTGLANAYYASRTDVPQSMEAKVRADASASFSVQ